MSKYLHANTARRQTLANVTEVNYPEMDEIMKEIQEAITKGKFGFTLYRNDPLPRETVLKLKTLNYKVSEYKSSVADDPDYTEDAKYYDLNKPVEEMSYWEREYAFDWHCYISWEDSKEFYER